MCGNGALIGMATTHEEKWSIPLAQLQALTASFVEGAGMTALTNAVPLPVFEIAQDTPAVAWAFGSP